MARLEVMFADIVRRMDDQHAMLGEIRAQTTKTNGRINVAEVQIATLMARSSGAMVMDASAAVMTRASLQWYVLLVIGSIGGTITVLRFLGMLK